MNKFIFIFFLLSTSLFGFSQTADFTFQSSNGLFCNPATIQFTQNCTGTPIGYVWDFGNNTSSYSANASNTYIQPGSYTVTLTAIYDQTAVEVSKNIVINPVSFPLIGVDRNYICKPGIINFTASGSGNITNYQWNFGDTSGIVNTTSKNISHSYANYATYIVTLNATNNFGCIGKANRTVMVKKLPITSTIVPTQGCIPVNAGFRANVTVPVGDAVSNYTWNFGDGSPQISTTTNTTSRIYNTAGSYSPVLSVTTNQGCSNNYNYPAIAFGTPPLNHIAYPKKSMVCGSESPQFVSKAINADSYVWDFGDSTIQTVSDTITQHKYSTLGNKTVTVTPYYNGCAGTTISFQISIVGIITKYSYVNRCADKKTFSFVNTSLGTLSTTLWNFGDGSPIVNTRHAVHTFPSSGTFTTTLTVTNLITGCSDLVSHVIYTADPIVNNTDSSICRNDSTTFSVINSYANSAASYKWNVAGKQISTGTNPGVTVKANTFGNFNNYVIINNGGRYCPDTIWLNHAIKVNGPDLDFTAPGNICLDNLYNVVNSSQPYTSADSVVLWYWNFGTSIKNDTVYQPQPFKYARSGSYAVKLFATDINGCKDSLMKTVSVKPLPYIKLVHGTDTICSGQSDTLIAFHSDSIFWSPGIALSCTTCDTVLANPSVNAIYFATAKNSFNCVVSDSIQIKVYLPFTADPAVNLFYSCLNDQVVLDIDPKFKIISWSPAAGLSNPNIYNPVASPLQNTTYRATITDSAGCFSSTADINVLIKSSPFVDAGPDRIYPYNTNYTITPLYGNNISSYTWTPSDLLTCQNCPTPSGITAYTQTYTIKVTSDSGCVSTDSITIGVDCNNANLLMPSAFTPNNDKLNDFYYPLTRGFKTITKFLIYNRSGLLIYENKNFPANVSSFGWDGKYKAVNQTPGTYVYVLEALCEVGKTISRSGSFLLLR